MFALKRQEWRKHPKLSLRYNLMHSMPGLTWALAAFAIYCAGEYIYESNFKAHKHAPAGHIEDKPSAGVSE